MAASDPTSNSARLRISRLRLGLVMGTAMSWARRSCTGSMTTAGDGLTSVLATPTPSASNCSRSTFSRLRVPSTSKVCVRSGLTPAINRNPRPITCSGRISALAVNGRSPSTTETLRTSHPSRSIITLTITLILLLASSMSRATWRAASKSFLVTSPALSV